MNAPSEFFIKYWTTQLKGKALARAKAAIRAIDPSCDLVLYSATGNDVRMWLERPADGTNNYDYVILRNQRCVDAVEAEMSLEEVAK